MSEPMTDENLEELEAIHAKCVAEHTHAPSRFCLFADHARIIFPRLLAEVKRLRAAEQPPTPPAGRGEERERMEDIRDAHTGRLTYLKINGFRLSATDEHIRDLIAFIDSRDAVIARLEKIVGLQQAALERWKECRAQGTYPTAPGPVIE